MSSKVKRVEKRTARLAGDVEAWLAIVARVVARITQERRTRKSKV